VNQHMKSYKHKILISCLFGHCPTLITIVRVDKSAELPTHIESAFCGFNSKLFNAVWETIGITNSAIIVSAYTSYMLI
ncbi:hypothetical protein C2G38_2128718, partial [Gigaspora rosea]